MFKKCYRYVFNMCLVRIYNEYSTNFKKDLTRFNSILASNIHTQVKHRCIHGKRVIPPPPLHCSLLSQVQIHHIEPATHQNRPVLDTALYINHFIHAAFMLYCVIHTITRTNQSRMHAVYIKMFKAMYNEVIFQ